MSNLNLSEIWIYPIKSLGGISLKNAIVEQRGLQYDRRWMLVDENGMFLTQRKHHEMALLKVEIIENNLKVTHKIKSTESIKIPLKSESLENLKVQVWDDKCEAYTISDDINHWFSNILGINCRLVYMPNDSLRQIDERYSKTGDITSFSDAYPILILGQSALNTLNSKLENKISINRFRPNLVFTGGTANIEDTWKNIQIGEANLNGVKPCARCIMTTINQNNGKSGKEPLKTLATYRKVGKKILFGQNLIPTNIGVNITVGDEIQVLKY